jgi:hypothetical protein
MYSTSEELHDEVLAHGFSAARYSTRVYQYLSEAQNEIIRATKMRVNQDTEAYTTTSGDATYSLPSDYVDFINLTNDNDDQILEPMTADDYDSLDSTTTGTPTQYLIFGNVINLYPAPDGEYTINLRYWRLPTAVTSSNNPSIPVDRWGALIDYALFKAYKSEHDPAMAQMHREDFEVVKRTMQGQLQDDVHDGPIVIGGTWGPQSPMRFDP